MTYAKDDAHLRRYLTYLLNREYMVSSWKQNNYSESVLNNVKQKGNIKLIDMYQVVKDVDIATVKKEHTEMEGNMDYFEPVFY